MRQSAEEVMASVFWDVQVIIYIDYLDKGKSVNSENYTELLVCLKDEISKKWPHMKKKIIFHQGDAGNFQKKSKIDCFKISK